MKQTMEMRVRKHCVNAIYTMFLKLYTERYPNRMHPDRKTFERLDQRIRNSNCLMPKPNVDVAHRRIRPIEMEERIIEMVELDPTISTRVIGHELNINHVIVHRVLKDELLHPFHRTKVQELNVQDYRARQNFCRWLLHNNETDENFLTNIMWTDESLFTRTGIFNCHNEHYYDVINPRVTHTRSFQHRWKLNYWAGILGDRIIGPILLPDILTVRKFKIS